jgi:hypothetical protein
MNLHLITSKKIRQQGILIYSLKKQFGKFVSFKVVLKSTNIDVAQSNHMKHIRLLLGLE